MGSRLAQPLRFLRKTVLILFRLEAFQDLGREFSVRGIGINRDHFPGNFDGSLCFLAMIEGCQLSKKGSLQERPFRSEF